MNQIPARHKANAPTTRPPMQTIPVVQQRQPGQHSFSQQFVFLPVLVGEFMTWTADIFSVVRFVYSAEITSSETEFCKKCLVKLSGSRSRSKNSTSHFFGPREKKWSIMTVHIESLG